MNCGAASVGVLQDNLVLSTGLLMYIGHRKETCDRSDEGLTLETSAFESLYGGQRTLATQLIKPNYLTHKHSDLPIASRRLISLADFK